MNNDPTPTSAAALVPENENENTTAALNSATASNTGPPENAPTPAQSRVTLQMKKKYEFIDHIMNSLDMLIYVELCILYYMDCSFFRLIIRVLAQVMFLTPKPSFVPPMPKHRPYIGAIFGPNIICILLHVFTSRSEAGEAMRGYLHGGMIIDLIGQKGPTSKMHLVLLDLLVTALQCFMLSVHVERERLRDVLLPKPAGVQAQPTVITAQDHDAEERGVMRDSVAGNGNIEMQPIGASAGEASGANGSQSSDMDQERERLLAEPSHRDEAEEDEYPLDIFYSGTAMVGEFHVLHTLRTQWDDYGNATASALQTVGFSAEFAAASADRRIVAVRRGLESSFN